MKDIKILVIDDEPGIREGCRRTLARQGFAIDTASSGEEGLHLVKSTAYDLALVDVMMPGISGIDLITRIHEQDAETVCIIITGYATVELAVTAIKRGAYDFLTKPFTTDDLLLVVNQGLERRQLSLEARRLQKIEAEAQVLAAEKARLEELDKAKVAFIRLVTHELKAPISAISTYLDLILTEYIAPEQQREYLLRCQERAEEQLALISDILEFGRLKEIKTAARLQRVQMDALLQSVLQKLEPQAIEKKLCIECEVPAQLPPVYINPDHAASIWTNLISNAVKYTPSGGKISICLHEKDRMVEGQVIDTGIGIPEDALDSLFTEFFRARNAKDLNIPGTGLGLAIVKQIVEKAGGEIRAESTPGSGSKFIFALPVAE